MQALDKQYHNLTRTLSRLEAELRQDSFSSLTLQIPDSSEENSTSFAISVIPDTKRIELHDRVNLIRTLLALTGDRNKRTKAVDFCSSYTHRLALSWSRLQAVSTQLNVTRGELDHLIQSSGLFHPLPMGRLNAVYQLGYAVFYLMRQIQLRRNEWLQVASESCSTGRSDVSLYMHFCDAARDLFDILSNPSNEGSVCFSYVEKQKVRITNLEVLINFYY